MERTHPISDVVIQWWCSIRDAPPPCYILLHTHTIFYLVCVVRCCVCPSPRKLPRTTNQSHSERTRLDRSATYRQLHIPYAIYTGTAPYIRCCMPHTHHYAPAHAHTPHYTLPAHTTHHTHATHTTAHAHYTTHPHTPHHTCPHTRHLLPHMPRCRYYTAPHTTPHPTHHIRTPFCTTTPAYATFSPLHARRRALHTALLPAPLRHCLRTPPFSGGPPASISWRILAQADI